METVSKLRAIDFYKDDRNHQKREHRERFFDKIMGMSNDRTRRILVSIPTNSYAQRHVLEGVLKYARERHGDNWRLQLDLGGFVCQRLKCFADWKCDGIIAYIDDPSARAHFLSAKLPTVLIEPFLSPHSKIPARKNTVTFVNDDMLEGETAAKYFLARHFKSFAYIGSSEKTPWVRLRERGFVKFLQSQGYSCKVYPELMDDEREDFAREMPRLVKWLKDLPRPTAVFTPHDLRARQILTAADAADIDVPGHIAVLGVDNDELICETATPALSSISTRENLHGYACGRALEELFRGHPGNRVIRTAHTHVVSRASTDINAIDDPFVARALNWAHHNLSTGASVDAIAKGIGYSKRMLQIRARRSLGQSLSDEIRRLMLTSAAELLSNTDKSVSDIAAVCGFTSVSHLSLRFKKHYQQTPLAYRKATYQK